MIVVPVDTPGVNILRDIPAMNHPRIGARLDGGHAEIIYTDVRVPVGNLIGNPGDRCRLAQQRLGPGRIHHAMRWLGQSRRAFDMLCERAVSRETPRLAAVRPADDPGHGGHLGRRDCRRPAAHLHAAWTMDTVGASNARTEIGMIKYLGARVLHDVIDRAIQVHGSLGFTGDLPLEQVYRDARAARIYDGLAEHDLAGLCPFEVQVRVVLPGEADPAVQLDASSTPWPGLPRHFGRERPRRPRSSRGMPPSTLT